MAGTNMLKLTGFGQFISVDKCLRLTTGHCERDTAASTHQFTTQPQTTSFSHHLTETTI